MKNVKRLFLDIETSHTINATFGQWPKYIPHDNILQDWYIICAAWKWEGERKVHGYSTYTKNDKKVVKALRKAILEAEELVYHNGRKFDYKKLNTRVILNDLPPMDKPRETDTLIQCRKYFSFSSNRLDYIGKVLVDDVKLPTSNKLWLDVLQGDKKSVDDMLKYCKQDVNLLEKVFLKLKPHIEVGFNMNINEKVGDKCPKCGSSDLHGHGYRYTKTCKYRRYRCNTCHSYIQSGNRERRENSPVR